jgi:hypothetical protein
MGIDGAFAGAAAPERPATAVAEAPLRAGGSPEIGYPPVPRFEIRRNMNPLDDYPDVLQNIESTVVAVWRQNPAMNNYAVMAAYDAAIQYYRAQANGQKPKELKLTALDAAIFEAVSRACEFRLGRTADPAMQGVAPIPLEDLVACLRKLRKSVDFWTEQGGRQGYLRYIEQFVG